MNADMKRPEDIKVILATDCGSTTTKAILIEKVEGEYRLQTTEGAAWESEFRRRRSTLLNNEPQLAAHRLPCRESQALGARLAQRSGWWKGREWWWQAIYASALMVYRDEHTRAQSVNGGTESA